MPRTTKSPVKSPAELASIHLYYDSLILILHRTSYFRPQTPPTPHKKAVSKLFIDDEAENFFDADEFPTALAQDPAEESLPVNDQYTFYFASIASMNPFDGASPGSPELTPPPQTQAASPRKAVPRPRATATGSVKKSPVKKKALKETMIDIASSEEDLEAMDEDVSMFRKPSGVKATFVLDSLSQSSCRLTLPLGPCLNLCEREDVPIPSVKSPNKKLKTVPEAPAPIVLPDLWAISCPPFLRNIFRLLLQLKVFRRKPQHLLSLLDRYKMSHHPRVRVAKQSSPDWEYPYSGNARALTPVTPSPSAKGASSAQGKVVLELDNMDDDNVSTEVSKFMQSPGKYSASSNKPKTMAGFFGEADNSSPSIATKSTEVSTVFLEDIETYKAHFDPSAPCGVFDIDLQDKALRSSYPPLVPLPSDREIITAYDPNRIAGIVPPDIKGGRIEYSICNSMGALMFESSAPNFINPSRVSPLRLSSKTSIGSTTTQRLHVDDRIATCVSALFCSESKLVVPVKIGGKSERMRKGLSGIFHNQEWERFHA
ncbi:hypothetical protein B0H17DRAFT_1144974 [Mycena rosella]|uniref:Uncharacterized protein n=1 Tax=Mycena rosella TaxID=1033263 RepID=A0AAD7CS40_MYCRO|nr:hypothetical protein B0H17DRAFT_1144974 [Mycena rosella]